MSETPDLSTLPARMRYAGEVCSEAAARLSPNEGQHWYQALWSSMTLHNMAGQFELQDRAAEKTVNDLARDMYEISGWSGCAGSAWNRLLPNDADRHRFLKEAGFLIARGWTKAADE